MANLTIQEASIIGALYEFAKSGAGKEEISGLQQKLQSPAAKRLAEMMIKRGIQDKNMDDAMKEYRELALEYKKLTGKGFKRNGWDMHNKHTKLQAIKIRIKQIQDRQDLRSVLEENRKKHGPDFNLTGAL